jgi:hypothetical protein
MNVNFAKRTFLLTLLLISWTVMTTPAYTANLLTQGDFTGAAITSQSFDPSALTPNTAKWLGINQWIVVTNTEGFDSPASNSYAKHLSNGKVRLFQAIDASSLELSEYRISFRYIYETGFATNEDPYVWVLGVNSVDSTISQFPSETDGFPSGGTPSAISNWDVLFQKKLAGACPFAGCANGPSLPVPWTLVDEVFDLTSSYDFLVVVFTFGAFGDNAVGLRGIDNVILERNIIKVYVDVKPGSCPNPLNVASKGVLPVAILGTEDFDVTTIDPETIQLEGVTPLRWAYADVGTPFDSDKLDCYDCNELCGDGYMDLVLNFETQDVVAAIDPVFDGQCVFLNLTGNLTSENGGTPVEGEDVVWIINKKPVKPSNK